MSKYGFDKMQVGDTLTFKGQDRHGKAGNAAKSFFRLKNWNLQIRKTRSGVDITRMDGGYLSNEHGTFRGNLPQPDEGWEQIGRCMDADRVEWLVFSRPQDHTPDWMTYKIVANGRARNKANYWMVKNIETGQIGFARDYVHMRDNRPELHAQVEAIFKKVILK